MKRFLAISFGVLFALMTFDAEAQFSISPTERNLQGTIVQDSLSDKGTINNPYFNLAKWKADRRALRKQRNTLEMGATLQISQTSFENWGSGGNNTFSGRTTCYLTHVNKKNDMSMTTRVNVRYGMNVIDGASYKNEDEFKINWQMAWKMHKWWSYAGTVNLRSQFTKGYKSRTDKTLISSFMSPGYTDVALGFNYKKDGSPFNITLSPLTGNIVVVLKDTLSKQGIAGVKPGDKTKGKIGPSVNIYFDKYFGKDKKIRYRSNFYAFSNIKTSPQIRWENTLDLKAAKYFTATFYLLAYYDKDVVTPKPESMQYKYSISIGLSYTFKNK